MTNECGVDLVNLGASFLQQVAGTEHGSMCLHCFLHVQAQLSGGGIPIGMSDLLYVQVKN